jgi:hypothetical protein
MIGRPAGCVAARAKSVWHTTAPNAGDGFSRRKIGQARRLRRRAREESVAHDGPHVQVTAFHEAANTHEDHESLTYKDFFVFSWIFVPS